MVDDVTGSDRGRNRVDPGGCGEGRSGEIGRSDEIGRGREIQKQGYLVAIREREVESPKTFNGNG